MSEFNLDRDPAVEQTYTNMLPDLSPEEEELLTSLPDEYTVSDVPYIKQEKKHWSGAAVVQMLMEFYGKEPDSQEEIVETTGWEDWRKFDHSTFREKLFRYMARQGFLVSEFFPQGHVAPNDDVEDGIEAANFIRGNPDEIHGVDFEYFQALLVERDAPLVVRLYFTDEQYPMSREKLRHMGRGGQCALMIGYDEDGFIFHDPWDREAWGGTQGGPDQHISYETLAYERHLMNYTSDMVMAVDQLEAEFPVIKRGVKQDADCTLEMKVRWPGITGIQYDWYGLNQLGAELTEIESFDVEETNQVLDEPLLPGQTTTFQWDVTSGTDPGCYRIEGHVKGRLQVDEIPWELESEELDEWIKATAVHTEIVHRDDLMRKFGIRAAHEAAELEQRNVANSSSTVADD